MWRRCTVRSTGTHRSENAGMRQDGENPIHQKTMFQGKAWFKLSGPKEETERYPMNRDSVLEHRVKGGTQKANSSVREWKSTSTVRRGISQMLISVTLTVMGSEV